MPWHPGHRLLALPEPSRLLPRAQAAPMSIPTARLPAECSVHRPGPAGHHPGDPAALTVHGRARAGVKAPGRPGPPQPSCSMPAPDHQPTAPDSQHRSTKSMRQPTESCEEHQSQGSALNAEHPVLSALGPGLPGTRAAHNGGSRVLTVTSNCDAALPLLKSVSLPADSGVTIRPRALGSRPVPDSPFWRREALTIGARRAGGRRTGQQPGAIRVSGSGVMARLLAVLPPGRPSTL